MTDDAPSVDADHGGSADESRDPDATTDPSLADAIPDDAENARDADIGPDAADEPGPADAPSDISPILDEAAADDGSGESTADDMSGTDGTDTCAEPPVAPPPTDLPPLAFPPPLGVIWSATSGGQTNGSPSTADLDRDGALDFVAGGGVENSFGTVMTVSGSTGEIVWQTDLRDEVFTRPLLLDLNADCVADVVVGGRTGVLVAVDGRDGSLLWQFAESDPRDDGIFNCLTPQPIDDITGDGIPELLFANGGDARAPPFTLRPPGHLLVIDPVDGSELGRAATPDLRESYMSPIVVSRPDGRWVLVGTGGETAEGSLWAVPLAAIVGSATDGAVELVPPARARASWRHLPWPT